VSINWDWKTAPRAAWFLLRLRVQSAVDRQFNRDKREDSVLDYVRKNAEEGSAAAVLGAMDEFASKKRWLMNIGPEKGKILTTALAEAKATNVLELGAYCGYSAVLIGQYLQSLNDPGGRLVSIEKNARYAKVTREMVAHAGLSEVVEVRTGTLATEIEALRGPFDLVLLDHWKEEYLADLQRLESSELLRIGSTVVADNIGFFAVPEYLNYVREGGHYRSRFFESSVEYNEKLKDGVEVSVYTG